MSSLRLAVATILAAASGVASLGPTINNHKVLGITRAATFEDIQFAYQKLASRHTATRMPGQPPDDSFVEIQNAYEAISNKDMNEDALRFIDYWGDVVKLEDDADLRRFAEFQPEGSSRLRMITVMGSAEEQNYAVYSAATKFGKRIRVGQLSQTEALTPQGEVGEFLSSLKLRQYPAVVLFDPITRGMKVRYGFDGIGDEIERLLQGDLTVTDKIGGIQEFDRDAYTARCENKGEDEVACTSNLIFATSAALETRRSDLVEALRPFMDACRANQVDKAIEAPCFWLRLGRAPEWQTLLRAKGVDVDADVSAFALLSETEEISVAPADVPKGSTEQIAAWFRTILEGEGQKQSLGARAPLPDAVGRDEEPLEDTTSAILRKAQYHAECVFVSACRQKQMETLNYQFQMFLREKGYEGYYVQVMNMDVEMQVAAVGALMLVAFILLGLCRKCICGSRPKRGSEEGNIACMQFLVPVNLKKGPGQKFGIGICSHGNGGLQVTSVDEGGLLHAWNVAQPRIERRICQGDRIVFVSGTVGGALVRATAHKKMIPILQSEEANMVVERSADDRQVQRIVGTCTLDGLSLQGSVELAPVEGSGADDYEVTSLGPALQQWNQAKAAQGACCTQRLEVGDRIVSVNGIANVQSQLGTVSGALVIVRWRAKSNVTTQRIEVSMEKTNPDDKWGMQIRRRIAEPLQMEVLEVVDSGLLTRWNSTPGNPQVFKGDRIISGNGQQEITAITNALHEPKLKLELERWVDSSSGESPGVAAPVGGAPAFAPPGMGSAPPMPGVQPPMGAAPPAMGAMPPQMLKPAANMPLAAAAPQAFPAAQMAPPAKLAAPQAFPAAQMAPPSYRPPPAMPARSPLAQPAPPAAEPASLLLRLVSFVVVLVLGSAIFSGGSGDGVRKVSPETRKHLERIHPELYFDISGLLLLLGLLMTMVFVRNQARGPNVMKQLCVSALASTLLGFGGFFLLAWAGVYV